MSCLRVVFACVLLAVPSAANAAWPLPASAAPAEHADGGNWPSDPGYATSDWLWSHTADGIGASVDRAFSVTRGSPKVVISALGAGVDFESKDLVNKWALSRGELTPPQNANGNTVNGPDPHDRNGDGRFNMQDYTSATGTALPLPALAVDPRLANRADKGDVNGNGLLDPEDLLALFGNGQDEDTNGLVDDVCGFDFAMNDANARAETALNDTEAAELAAAQTNDGFGRAGACPECLVLPFRVALADQSAPGELARALRRLSGGVALVTSLPVSMNDELRSAAAATPALIISSPSPRAGTRLETLDLLPAALRADPVGADRVRPSFAPRALTPSLLVPPVHAPSAILAGIAGLLLSRAEELSVALDPARTRAVLLQSESAGRVNARSAVDAVGDGRIPPAVALSAPAPHDHFAVGAFDVRARVTSNGGATLVLEAAPGVAPASFTEVARVAAAASFDDKVGTVDPAALTFPPSLLRDDPFSSALTIRLRAEATLGDGGTVSAEARETVFLTLDHQLRAPFPLAIPAAGAASLKLVDVDGDVSDDLIVPTADGKVYAYNEGGAPLSGFPVVLDGGGIFAPAAVTDFDNNSIRDIAVVSESGQLSLFDGLGRMAQGFPVWLDCRADGGCPATKTYAAPVLFSSPSGGLLIQGDAHGHLHIFVDDGTELAGSPVQVGSADSPIVATPAVGDVDDDGWPDIIVGTAELSPAATQTKLTRLSLGTTGVFEVTAFDVELEVAPGNGLALHRRGIIASPVIANLDRQGRREILARSTGSPLRAYRSDGIEVVEFLGSKPQAVASTLAVADLNHDGPFEVIESENDTLHAWAAGRQEIITAGKPSIGPAPELPSFPFAAPSPALSGFAIADVDGDRDADLLFTSEEPLVHAISRSGAPVNEWPKQLPGGSNAHVAVGVMGNRLVVAALTRDGRAYVWDAVGTPADIQWDSFHHDPANTGSTGTALPARKIAGIGSRDTPPPPPESCCTGAPSSLNYVGLGALLLSLRLARVRRRAI